MVYKLKTIGKAVPKKLVKGQSADPDQGLICLAIFSSKKGMALEKNYIGG
jgi:hypothetical protein